MTVFLLSRYERSGYNILCSTDYWDCSCKLKHCVRRPTKEKKKRKKEKSVLYMGNICTQQFQPEGLTHTIPAIAHRNGEIQTRVHAWDAHISTAVQDVMQLRLFVPTEEVARHFATCNRSSRTPLGLTWCHVATSSNAWQNSPPCSCRQANYPE